jgi:hypothetical protein
LTRERVRQILNETPNFDEYLAEFAEAKADRERQIIKDRKFARIEKSLANQFPDRIDELWDLEKNGDLNLAEVMARSTAVEIWWRCPRDGHSWKKRPSDIVTSWRRSRTSGVRPVREGRRPRENNRCCWRSIRNWSRHTGIFSGTGLKALIPVLLHSRATVRSGCGALRMTTIGKRELTL